MADLRKQFHSSSTSIAGFFQEKGLGFYIPLYQRDYSWDENNIDQLMEDICQGIENLLEDPQEIRFLGTIIRVTENKNNIEAGEPQAIPTRIDSIIDGQQRISTIALLAALIYQRLQEIGAKLPEREPYSIVRNETIPGKLAALEELFSVDLRGEPSRKPIIIRGEKDHWTYKGNDEEHYKSDVTHYLACVLRAIYEKSDIPPVE